MADDHKFGQTVPPLAEYLKGFLDRYKEGQIIKASQQRSQDITLCFCFKELLQNADDAGATKLEITLDLREFGKRPEILYEERLGVCQGPALVAFNDALFTDVDWKNIQQPERSSKRHERQKIGRFGIGFNSVYHLTDFPWILSGSNIAVLDPRQTGIFENRVTKQTTAGFKWDMMNEEHRAEIQRFSHQFAPFHSVPYDFIPGENQTFNGTLIRLPLRQTSLSSDPYFVMSEVVYTDNKIMELFQSFQTEANHVLLFLSHVETVKLFKFNKDGHEPILIHETNRKPLLPVIICQPQDDGEYKYHEIQITIIEQEKQVSAQDWAIVNHTAKESQAYELPVASEFHPSIALACPLNSLDTPLCRGLIFCYLPLPENETGLPIHIHGCFCLTESRRSLQWPTENNQNDNHRRWNMILVNEHLPEAYLYLLKVIRNHSRSEESTAAEFSNDLIKQLWPDQVMSPLQQVVSKLYEISKDEQLFQTVTGEFVEASQAEFLNQCSHRSSIEQLCKLAEKPIVVDYPEHIVDRFHDVSVEVVQIDPKYVCNLLRHDQDLLDSLDTEIKLDLLEYVLLDSSISLEGVPLLPLADGSFRQFCSLSDPIYVDPSNCYQEMIPGNDSCFLDNDYIAKLKCVTDSDQSQLKQLQPEHIPDLLRRSLTEGHWKVETHLELMWDYIRDHNATKLKEFHNLPLIPIHNKDKPTAAVNLDPENPILSLEGLPNDVIDWLHDVIGLKLAIPEPYLPESMDEYILNPALTGNSLIALRNVWAKDPERVRNGIQQAYDQHRPWQQEADMNDVRKCFPWLLNQILICNQIDHLNEFIKEIPIFEAVPTSVNDMRLISAKQADFYYLETNGFGINDLLHKILFAKHLIQITPLTPTEIFTKNSIMDLLKMDIWDFTTYIFASLTEKFYEGPKVNEILDWVFTQFDELKKEFVEFNMLDNFLLIKQRFIEIGQNKPIDQGLYLGCCDFLVHNASTELWSEIVKFDIIPCKNGKLHTTGGLINGNCPFVNVCPYVCQPADWLTNEKFLDRCQIREKLSLQDMTNIIMHMENDYHNRSMDEVTLTTFIQIIKEIRNETEAESQMMKPLPLPDRTAVLKPPGTLLWQDSKTTSDSFPDYMHSLVHNDIPSQLAVYFGAKTRDDVLLEEFEQEEDGENFGQEVDLIERIKQLLDQYSAETDFFQEFLQNADDAKASKIAFILDERHHSTEDLLSEKWKELQGPSILVFNDSKFTDDDIRGIQHLGIGSKANDPVKIGKYGAGFNCAFRYSDCPSFVSDDDVLCIFDPLRRYFRNLKQDQKCGRRFNLSCPTTKHDFRIRFPAIYESYILKGFNLKESTMFRLPLRYKRSEENANKIIFGSPQTIDSILSLFGRVAQNLKTLFLNNVKMVCAHHVKESGEIFDLWKYETDTHDLMWLTGEQMRLEICNSVTMSPLEISTARSAYKVKMMDTQNEFEEWLVVQRLGFVERCDEDKNLANLKELPVANVAARFNNNRKNHLLYCALPLPQTTCLPVSINGHFFLTEGRKQLFKAVPGQTDVRHLQWNQWNNKLLKDVASNAYLDFLEVHKTWYIEDTRKITDAREIISSILHFWELLPIINHESTVECEDEWDENKDFAKNVIKKLAESDRELIPCLTQCENSDAKVEWLNMDDDVTVPVFLGGSWFSTSVMANENENHESVDYWLSRTLISFVKLLGMKVTPCSKTLLDSFHDAHVKFCVATPSTLAHFLRTLACDWSLPLAIEETKLQTESRVADLLKFVTRNVGQHIELEGVPLLLSSDNRLKCFSAINPVKLESDEMVITLFPRSSTKFASKDICCILKKYAIQLRNSERKDETLSELNISDLFEMATIELIEMGLKPIEFCSTEEEFPILENWLKTFWALVHHLITDTEKAKQFMQLFLLWPLLPARQSPSGPLLLFRTDKAPFLVNIDLWKNISSTTFLDGLPIVEKEYFQTEPCIMMQNLRIPEFQLDSFQQMFYGASSPERMLDALMYWKERLKWPNDTSQYKEVAFGILKLFAPLSPEQLLVLRELKIFESIHGEFVAVKGRLAFTLEDYENVPKAGQQTWISQAVFLKNHEVLQPLYQKIQIKSRKLVFFYVHYVIPSLHRMIPSEQTEHLHFLQHKRWTGHPIEVLRQAKFITVENKKKALHELCDRSVSLFEQLYGEEEFLPEDFQMVTGLLPFLKELGLRVVPTISEHIKIANKCRTFAKRIPPLPPGTIEKVVKQLLESAESYLNLPYPAWHSCIEELSTIDFIPCKRIHVDLLELCPTPLESITMIRAKGNCTSTYQLSETLSMGKRNTHHLIWTTSQCLPDWFPPALYEKMGVCQLPNIKLVLEHSDKLLQCLYKRKLKHKSYSPTNADEEHLRFKLKKILTDFYSFLQNHFGNGTISIREMPMVFVENGNGLAFPRMTVERLPDYLNGCISPFLYELPAELYKHKSLFQRLGMQEKASITHYARFMKMVVKRFSKNVLDWDQKLLLSVVHVQNEIIISAAKTCNWETIGVDILYLLGSDKSLHRSCELVFEDDRSISALLNNAGIIYWWFPDFNFQCEEASVADKCSFVDKLPEDLRMKNISHIISKCVSNKSIKCEYDDLCPGAKQLKVTLRSPEFRRCIMKLLSAENNQMGLAQKSNNETIANVLNNFQIKCYSSLIIELQQTQHISIKSLESSQKVVQAFMAVNGKVLNISHCNANRIPKSQAFVYHLCQLLRPLLRLNHSELGLTKLLMCSDVSEFHEALNWLDVDADQTDNEVAGTSAPDPEVALMALKYLKTANRDFRAAVAVRKCKAKGQTRIGNEHVIILAQQATEKALKAVLRQTIGHAEQGHNLKFFATQIEKLCDNPIPGLDALVKAFVEECDVNLSWLRYPDTTVDKKVPCETYNDPEQAYRSVFHAKEIIDEINKFFIDRGIIHSVNQFFDETDGNNDVG